MINELENTTEIQLVAFKLGEEEYSVPIQSVQEIIMPQQVTHLPKTPDFMEGIINLRGRTIPIIDGRKRFNMSVKENNQETRIIVLEIENHQIGLIVDSVSEVMHLKTENIDSAPLEADEDNKFIIGIGKYKDRLLILLEPKNFLDMRETQNIQKSVQAAKKVLTAKEELTLSTGSS